MKADFSRVNSSERYKRVLIQQGRVQLDSELNEMQGNIFRRIETETKDVIGLCGFPRSNAGFGVVELGDGDFKLTAGRCYVDGILCEIENDVEYSQQPYIKPALRPGSIPNGRYLVYLDVWERLITSLDDPAIREVALGGPDTAARSKVVWQVTLHEVGRAGANLNCDSAIDGWPPVSSDGTLCARTQPQQQPEDPCVVAPGAGYKRLENQLYRVEIQQGSNGQTKPTFTWSRDNGSIAVKITELNVDGSSDKLRLSSLGRDDVLGLRELDWVGLTDDYHELSALPGQLLQIRKIDREQQIVTLSQEVESRFDIARNPKLRRWDSAGELDVEIPAGNEGYIPLEDGLEVKFGNGSFHTGDYWCIAARTIPGQYGAIEWPQDGTGPACLLPFGIQHHYCKLALIAVANGQVTVLSDCRQIFDPLTEVSQPPDGVREVNCCSVTVGAGGDYASLKEAVDALSEAKSLNVCLLPGRHLVSEPVLVRNAGGITLSACGERTWIETNSDQPMLVFLNGQKIRLEGLIFRARARLGALLFLGCRDVAVVNCRGENLFVENRTDPAAAITLLHCQNVEISDNHFTCGGIRCLADITLVDIDRNQIALGPGAGIQLGGAAEIAEVNQFFEAINRPETGPTRNTVYARAVVLHEIEYVSIRDNLIAQMTGSGILAVNQMQAGEVSHLQISRNQILFCARQPDLVLHEVGRTVGGGIALSGFSGVTIEGNRVADNGSGRACCGIILSQGFHVEIQNNVIENNGNDAHEDATGAYQAGIAAFFILGDGQETRNPQGTAALRVHGNQVVTPAGLALIAVVMGAAQITDNVFVSQRRRNQVPLFGLREVGLCLQIMNAGSQGWLEGLAMIARGRVHTENADRSLRAAAMQMPHGPIMFHDNQVTLLFQAAQGTQASRIAAASAILSPNDISLQGNQFQVDLPLDQLMANVIAIGGTIRATGNNFREFDEQTRQAFFSYVSAATSMNITSLNTAVHCIAKQPANPLDPTPKIFQENNIVLRMEDCARLSDLFFANQYAWR